MKHKGFTLIEIMVVVAILGILATIALPAYQNYVNGEGATMQGPQTITPRTGVVGFNGYFNKEVTTIVTSTNQQMVLVNPVHVVEFDTRNSDYCTVQTKQMVDYNSPMNDRYNVVTSIDCE